MIFDQIFGSEFLLGRSFFGFWRIFWGVWEHFGGIFGDVVEGFQFRFGGFL